MRPMTAVEHNRAKGVRMKILVIGGSYFFGRVFVMQAAKEHDITVVNRGTYSMEEWGVKQVKGDRKDEGLWKSLGDDYDVIVDFCAYEENDISRVLRNMPGKVKQYIFISTVDVYERHGLSKQVAESLGRESGREAKGWKEDSGSWKKENAPLENRVFLGEAGSYIAGKTALEREVREECAAGHIHYTVLRPAVLYGPYNYAPRESAYIQLMIQNHILPHITDASGAFQFLYVKDAAEAVIKCLLNEAAYGQAYNLCQDEMMTYDLFFEELKKAADVELTEIAVTVEEARRQGIPLPFPVTEAETELYSNEKSKEALGIRYTSISDGMARTYRAMKGVYGG